MLQNNRRKYDTQQIMMSHLKRRKIFKRKKPPDEYHSNKTISFKFSIKTEFILLWIIASMMIVTVNSSDNFLLSSIEELTTSTTMRNFEPDGDGICRGVQVRNDLDKIHALAGCRVVEGSVAILLIDEIKEKDVLNITFPNLVEITGYLMLYRIGGFTTLNQLFPNLAVIRGRELFKDYSLIIYEMLELTEIGLGNLIEISRGNVRIEKNEKMCFVNTINWLKITHMKSEPYLEKNQMTLACPYCGPKCISNGQHFCWNANQCQRICPSSCNTSSSCSPNGKCCDSNCIGGCSDEDPTKCIACQKFSLGVYPNIVCVDKCSKDTYAYHDRRCLSKEECYGLNNFSSIGISSNENIFFPFNGSCIQECPQGYSKTGIGNKTTCTVCFEKCLKRCHAKIVDSIATAQALKGCSIIDGPLEIQIRGNIKNQDGNNIVKELEASLIDIVEINDYLKIARSHSILSFSFLKNLKRINGKKLESNRNALVVWENQNLQELWDENQKIEIGRGKLFFHFNPKLCFFKIENLANKSSPISKPKDLIENYDTAKLSNGDKTPCNVTPLNVTVVEILPQAALLSWPPLRLDDDRSLLNYVVYYIAAPHNNVTLWEGRDACGNDGWSVEDVTSFSNIDQINQPLTKLEPFTQYAYYVKAYTLATEQKGAQSDIKYFTTRPDQPQRVKKLKATPLGHDKIEVTWETLQRVNGRLDHYILRAKAVDQNENLLLQRDYCSEPILPHLKASQSKEMTKETPKIIETALDGTCNCKTCAKVCSADTVSRPIEDVDERQSANDFEDEIQDFVYVQNLDETTNEILPKETSRAKRQIEFPDKTDHDIPQQSHADRNLLKNMSDFYEDGIAANQTYFVITGLKHYTTYAISIRACRKPENDENVTAILCSIDNSFYGQTFMQPANDLIQDFDVETFTNGSNTDIKVTWTPPENPNGLLLSYQIRYKRVDIEHASYQSNCLSDTSLNVTKSHLIRGLPAGNYSIDMRATTLAGDGNYTSAKFVYIKEQGTNNFLFGVLGGLFIVFVICLLILYFGFKRMYLSSITSMKLIANVNPDYSGVTYKVDEWEIPRDKVIQLQELGQGSFGMVYEGIIKDFTKTGDELRCAIKTVNESATDKERISFLNEASVMKQFDTAHVVRLLGVVSRGQPTFVIMELMASGDLKSYLRLHRPEYDNGTDPSPQPPTLRQILQMAIEIADGMAYLSAKKFVHRDLAARNCMVADDLTVKIGDFGMTRDIYETDYYRKGTKGLLPVRWMSPESLKDGVFSSSTDIFSYGVVLWEMATLASQPYQGLSNDQVLRYVIEGGVMERPENCPDKLYELMRRCWQHRPSARPTFIDIITILLEDANSKFQSVSFYHSPQGQEILHQMMQGELAVQIADDITTPLRYGEDEEISSTGGNHFLMEEYKSDSFDGL